MIGVLRQGEATAETEPTKGTDRLGDLAAYLEGAGVKVRVDDSRYDRAKVPAYVDVAVYGIVREAATNIVRHSSASAATVRLALADDGVRLTVEDNGRGGAVSGNATDGDATGGNLLSSGGHGITGMSERARLLGGTFEAAPKFGGGFRVEAFLPIPKAEGTSA